MPDSSAQVEFSQNNPEFFGLERENLRITASGALATTPHPKAFGDKLTNPRITTDFSESQVEVITPVTRTLDKLIDQLEAELQTVYRGLNDELLWPLSSIPDNIPPGNKIPIADFGTRGRDKTDYRIYLAGKYGARKQLYCGLHINYSRSLRGLSVAGQNAWYLKLAASAMRYRFFLIRLLAASPEQPQAVHYRSIRLGALGYRNDRLIYPDYSAAECYLASLQMAVARGWIESPREFYQHVRIKGKGFDSLGEAPQASRIELRIPDLNPLFYDGINPDDLRLVHLYLFWAAELDEETSFDQKAQMAANNLADQAALFTCSDLLATNMERMFERLKQFVQKKQLPAAYRRALTAAEERWRKPEKDYARRIETEYAKRGPLAAALHWAVQAKKYYLGINPGQSIR